MDAEGVDGPEEVVGVHDDRDWLVGGGGEQVVKRGLLVVAKGVLKGGHDRVLGREDAGWKGLVLQRTAKAPGLCKVQGRHVVGQVGDHEVSKAAESGGRCVQAAHGTACAAANAKVDDGAAKERLARLRVRVLDDGLHGERLGGHSALVSDDREEPRLDVARQPGKLGVGVVDDEHGREGRHDRPVWDRQNLEGQLPRVLLQQMFPSGRG